MEAKTKCKEIANKNKIELIKKDLKIIFKRKKDKKILGISLSKSKEMLWEDCLIALKDIYHIKENNNISKAKIIGEGGNKVKYIILKKEDNFFQWLKQFLGQKIEKKRLIFEKPKNRFDINFKKDMHECHFTKEGWRIDIFYGDKKIYLVYYENFENKKAMRKKIDEFADFSEYSGG